MAKKHVCSNPICRSNRFITASSVVEDWLVDGNGNFIEVVGTTEVTNGPDDDKCWFCAECGSKAVVAADAPEKVLPDNFRFSENELGCTLDLWCNNAGDLIRNGKYDVEEDSMPHALKRAYNALWSNGCWDDTYICYLDGKPGICMTSSYDGEYANELGLTYAELLDKLAAKGIGYALANDKCDVIVGKNAYKWVDPKFGKERRESILILWLPWDTPLDEFEKTELMFADTCCSFD